MKSAKESQRRAGLFLIAACGVLGLLLALLLDGADSGEGTAPLVIQKEEVAPTGQSSPADLDRLPVETETKRVGGAEEPGSLALEPEGEKKKTGTIFLTAQDQSGADVGFSLTLAKIDEAKGELRVFARPNTVQSPWESTELPPGLWRVCAFQLLEREAGFPFLLGETSVDVLVREGETAELGLSFPQSPPSVGALMGTVLFRGGPPQVPGRRRPPRGLFREPKTMVGLWNERGKLVDTVDVRGGPFENEFSFLQLPKGEHSVGVMWACGEILGWPYEEAQSVSAPSLQLALSAKAREAFSKVVFLSEDPVRPLPKTLHVTTVVDGRVVGGEMKVEGSEQSIPTPPLGEHEVQWLVRAQGYKTELVSEERLLFFREDPSVPLRLEKGRELTAIAVPCSLAELLVYDDPGFLLASCGGLEGVELRRRGASLGVTGSAGIIIFSSLSRGALSTVRPSPKHLLVVDERGVPLTRKLSDLYVMPVVAR